MEEVAPSASSKPPLLTQLPYRLKPGELNTLASEDEVQLLRFELNCALLYFSELDKSIYLEGLGIVLPHRSEVHRTHYFDRWGIVRTEAVRTFRFEKCFDLSGLPSQDLSSLIETRHLAQRIYPRLPLALQIRWNEQDLRCLLRSYIQDLKNKLVQNGICTDFRSLGTFFALHNRQGRDIHDWFSGADILLCPRHQPILTVGRGTVFDRPVLENAWELLIAALEKPVLITKLSIADHLSELEGEESIELKRALSEKSEVEVAIFRNNKNAMKDTYLYCTEGLRHIRLSQNSGPGSPHLCGTELVVQVPVPETEEVPQWPLAMLKLGWLLLLNTKSKSLKPAQGLSADAPLDGTKNCQLTSIFTTPLELASIDQLSTQGPFTYTNLVGIHSDEAELVRGPKRWFLLDLLKAKGIDQVTLAKRASLLAKTVLQV